MSTRAACALVYSVLAERATGDDSGEARRELDAATRFVRVPAHRPAPVTDLATIRTILSRAGVEAVTAG